MGGYYRRERVPVGEGWDRWGLAQCLGPGWTCCISPCWLFPVLGPQELGLCRPHSGAALGPEFSQDKRGLGHCRELKRPGQGLVVAPTHTKTSPSSIVSQVPPRTGPQEVLEGQAMQLLGVPQEASSPWTPKVPRRDQPVRFSSKKLVSCDTSDRKRQFRRRMFSLANTRVKIPPRIPAANELIADERRYSRCPSGSQHHPPAALPPQGQTGHSVGMGLTSLTSQ